jgi:hypothetical protein
MVVRANGATFLARERLDGHGPLNGETGRPGL